MRTQTVRGPWLRVLGAAAVVLAAGLSGCAGTTAAKPDVAAVPEDDVVEPDAPDAAPDAVAPDADAAVAADADAKADAADAPDVTVDVAADADAADVAPDVAKVDIVAVDVAPDAAPDAAPDGSSDVAPDVAQAVDAADGQADVAADVPVAAPDSAEADAGSDAADAAPADDTLADVAAAADADQSPDAPAEPDVPADVPPQDIGPICPGGIGCACSTSADCSSGACAPTNTSVGICVAPCGWGCPLGTACVTLGANGEQGCVSKFNALCDPCMSDEECQGPGVPGSACVPHGDAGAFCGTPCKSNGDCPADFGCLPAYNLAGQVVVQCMPKPGAPECTCSPKAIDKGAQTLCKSAKGCGGMRSCQVDGLTACDAPAPSIEVCDGVDNDCDGVTDGPGLCNDNVACTLDICTPSGCTNDPQPGQCDDGSVCTQDLCTGSGCAHLPFASSCDDGNACTAGDVCKSGLCVGDPASACNDGNDCTVDSCEPVSGCKHVASTGPCSDGNACNLDDACVGTVCKGSGTLACDDGEVCTTDSCNPASGCVHAPAAGACTDNNACSTGDTCTGGSCKGAGTLPCDDLLPCTLDSCDAVKGCQHANRSGSCSDGNACTTGDACANGVCVPGPPAACDDNNPCTDDCNPAKGCVKVANTAACSDGNLCTVGDACKNSVCVPGPALDCNDGQACTFDSCVIDKGCVHTPNDSAVCDDKNVCTTGDYCSGGLCLHAGALNCDDGNPCTDDCDATLGCSPHPNAAACDDGNTCSLSDICSGGACKGGQWQTCDDSDPCTDDSCVNGSGCLHTNNTAPCLGTGACAIAFVCQNDACVLPSVPTCTDDNVCTDDCGSSGGCIHGNNTFACQDGDACTTGDKCNAGVCYGGPAANCDDANACTDDACDSGKGCTHTAHGGTCTDFNLCTNGDNCSGGVCVAGPALVCGSGGACDQVCLPNSGCAPAMVGTPCDDGNVCTTGDACGATGCGGAPVVCNDGNVCTDDSCDPVIGCAYAPNTASCMNGDPCTVGAKCAAGQCIIPGADDGKPCTLDFCYAGQIYHATQPGCVDCLNEAFAMSPAFSGKVASGTTSFVQWQLNGDTPGTPPFSLHAAWIGNGSATDVVVASYTTGMFGHAKAANLQFWLDANLFDATCGADDLEVWLDGKKIATYCNSTTGPQAQSIALAAKTTSSTVEFRLRAGHGAGKGGQVTIDDIRVGSGCTIGDFMVCGLCPSGVGCNEWTGACSYHTVFSEIAFGGSGGVHDEFIELYNPAEGPVTLVGLHVQWRAAGGNWIDLTGDAGLTATIPGHGFYLMTGAAYSGATASDFALIGGDLGNAGTVRLVDGSGAVFDLVGWGGGTAAYEGSAAATAAPPGKSIERKASSTSTPTTMAAGGAEAAAGNGFDSDVNSTDWLVRAVPAPQGLASPVEP